MSVLRNTRAYLSGAIEHDDPSHNWRVEPKRILIERFGIQVFDPFADPKQIWKPSLDEARSRNDYNAMSAIAKKFVRKDLALVDRADYLIAYLPYMVPTCGTHHEIINSVNAKKPTMLVCSQGKDKIPAWYFGFVPHEVMFGSWQALYDYLQEVEDGLHKDNTRWAFVYGLV